MVWVGGNKIYAGSPHGVGRTFYIPQSDVFRNLYNDIVTYPPIRPIHPFPVLLLTMTNQPNTPGAEPMTTRQLISAKRAELGQTECPICFMSPAYTVVEFGATVCAGRTIGNDHGMPYTASGGYSA